MESLPCTLSFC